MITRIDRIGKGLLVAVALSVGSGCLASAEDVDDYESGSVADDGLALYEDDAAFDDDTMTGEEIDLGVVLADLERRAESHEAFATADATGTGGDEERSNPEPTPWDPGAEDNPEPTPWRGGEEGGEEGSQSDNPEPTPWHRQDEEDDDDIDLDYAASANTTVGWDYGWD